MTTIVLEALKFNSFLSNSSYEIQSNDEYNLG